MKTADVIGCENLAKPNIQQAYKNWDSIKIADNIGFELLKKTRIAQELGS